MLHGSRTSRLRRLHLHTQALQFPFYIKQALRPATTLGTPPAMAATTNGAIGAMDPKNAAVKTLKMENVGWLSNPEEGEADGNCPDRKTRYPDRNREEIPKEMARLGGV